MQSCTAIQIRRDGEPQAQSIPDRASISPAEKCAEKHRSIEVYLYTVIASQSTLHDRLALDVHDPHILQLPLTGGCDAAEASA